MIREHERAISLAASTSDELRKLFNHYLGSTTAPNGRILRAYRVARRAMENAVGKPSDTRYILAELRATITQVVSESLLSAAEQGIKQAKAELAIYGLPNATESPDVSIQKDAWLAAYDGQAAGLLALSMQNDKRLLLGDASRLGAFTPAPILLLGARWLVSAAIESHGAAIKQNVKRSGVATEFKRQAIAGIDRRTTDCCLRVHGQVVGMDEPFKLSGTPRYADEQMNPGFHEFCRTSVALVRVQDVGDSVTQRLLARSSQQLERRENEARQAEKESAT